MLNEGQFIIKLENVTVKYRVPEERFGSFKEYLVMLLQNRVKMKDFCALREINLDIQPGEVFGIIGRNGAGKTTLLKVISRVLSPSSGRILIGGDVVPLLELGAGFHPELTGRENVFLNGALLGHTQREIRIHLSEILDFAQIDGYIDAPIRTYSSGMIARLGFAVATSWEPEILVLDEILAVGDEAFREKCFLRMKGFRERGATVIIISHDMNTIQSQCDRAIWMDQGSIQAIGDVKDVIAAYRKSNLIM
jgi:ABC-type polysaccharide/polyol phosphate transport system ATPase subunit